MINQIKPDSVLNKNIFAPLQSSGANYAISKPFTEEQKTEVKKEDEKKSNALGYSIAVTAVIAGFLVLGLAKGLPKGMRQKIDRLLAHFGKKSSTAGKSTEPTKAQKIVEKLKKYVNGIYNTGPVKDVAVKKGMEKLHMNKLESRISNLFQKISVKTSKNAYKNTFAKFDDMFAEFKTINEKIGGKDAVDIKKIEDEIKKTYIEAFMSNGRIARLKTINEELKDLGQRVWENTYGKKLDFVKSKDTYQTFISEKLAEKTKNSIIAELDAHKTKIFDNMDEISKIYKESGLPDNEIEKINKMITKSKKSLDYSTDLEGDKLFDKIRDIKIGSAPTEMLGLVASLGVIGWGLTKADNKDERISVALKYGVPAVGATAVSLYSTVRLVAGGKAILLGLISGLAINKLGAVLDNARKKYNEKPLALDDIKIPTSILPTQNKAKEVKKVN